MGIAAIWLWRRAGCYTIRRRSALVRLQAGDPIPEVFVELPFGLVTVVVVVVVIYLLSSIKILAEYERGVIFRLGRLLPAAKGPGIALVFAPLDRIVRVSLRQEALKFRRRTSSLAIT